MLARSLAGLPLPLAAGFGVALAFGWTLPGYRSRPGRPPEAVRRR